MEEFINLLNEYIKKERENKHINCSSFLVPLRILSSHPTFKAIQMYKAHINLVKQNKDPLPVFTISYSFNVSKEPLDEARSKLAKIAKFKLFSLISSKDWEDIINGTYKIKTNETT